MGCIEANVESFLERLGANVNRIPTEEQRTPDLLVTIQGVEVIVEIKSINENPNEKHAIQAIESRDVISLDHSKDIHRFISKIKDANNQLKHKCCGRPGIVVIADRRSFFTRSLNPQQILLEAMFGAETLWVTMPYPACSSPLGRVAHEFGLGRTVAPNANTTTSAVALFFQPAGGEPRLLIHHNPHAAVPLDPGLFRGPNVQEFIMPSTKQFADFVEIANHDT